MQRIKNKLIFTVISIAVLLASSVNVGTLVVANASEFPYCSAKGCAVIDVNTLNVLYEKNSDETLPMASTTKIVTALTVIENSELEQVVKVDKSAVGVEGSSIYLRENESLTVKELLYGLMLQSGNDCAVALAIHVSGSVEKFAMLMNETAARCGAKNSHFTNPHGLHDERHYTTAYDLALITAYALRNDVFRDIVSTKSVEISNDGLSYNRLILNKNKLLKNMDNATGVKTGYTKKAGRCFVGSAKKGKLELVCVLLNCTPMFEECESLLKYGLSQYTIADIVVKNELIGYVKPQNREEKYVAATKKGFSLIKKKGESIELSKEVILYDNINAPLQRGCVVGILNVYRQKQLLFSTKLYNIEYIE